MKNEIKLRKLIRESIESIYENKFIKENEESNPGYSDAQMEGISLVYALNSENQEMETPGNEGPLDEDIPTTNERNDIAPMANNLKFIRNLSENKAKLKS